MFKNKLLKRAHKTNRSVHFSKLNTDQKRKQKPYLLGVCAIFHSEQSFLQEWIDFHLEQGIERFYLYDNEPDYDKYKPILDPYIKKGQVLYHSWPDDPQQPNWTQRMAYFHCLKTYHQECKWIGFFDVDEFLFPEKEQTSLTNVNSIFKIYDTNSRLAQISVIRYNFGNYWHKDRPSIGGVTQNYRTRDKTFSNVKSIINTDFVSLHKPPDSVHVYRDLIKYGDTLDGQTCPLPLRFNHYLTKSTQDFMERNALWRKKRENFQFNPPDMCRFDQKLCPESFNQVYDQSILEFIPKLNNRS